MMCKHLGPNFRCKVDKTICLETPFDGSKCWKRQPFWRGVFKKEKILGGFERG